MSTIFGPVPSRRFGRSLGIDLIPAKTCTYDCLYCESGRTTHLTVARRAFVPPERVMADLAAYFADHPGGADVLTLSGAGEPTLYEPLGELLSAVKRAYPHLPLIVLTNGSLLSEERVRRDLAPADRVCPSCDAASSEVFRALNRPHPKVSIEQVIEGLRAFRREYRKEIVLEVLLVSGVNDSPEELRRIRRVIEETAPDRVELNTVVRPPAYPGVRGLTREAMEAAAALFPPACTKIIGHFSAPAAVAAEASLETRVVEMVGRRPCTAGEMAVSLGVSAGELDAALARLEASGAARRVLFDGREYWAAGGVS